MVQVSASFGTDVWDCKNYGQVLYAIKTRNGDVFLKLQSRGGDLSIFEASTPLSLLQALSFLCFCTACLRLQSPTAKRRPPANLMQRETLLVALGTDLAQNLCG